MTNNSKNYIYEHATHKDLLIYIFSFTYVANLKLVTLNILTAIPVIHIAIKSIRNHAFTRTKKIISKAIATRPLMISHTLMKKITLILIKEYLGNRLRSYSYYYNKLPHPP